MAQQKLDLLEFTAAAVAQFRTGAAQVMGCNVLQSRSLTTGPHHIPDYVLRYTFAPHLPRSTDRSKDPAPDNARLYGPFIQRDLDPGWNRDGADMASLAN